MKILLVLNKPNREIPIMESIKKEILLLDSKANVEIQEMCTPVFNRFVFKFKPDVILTFPFTCEGGSRWYYIFKYFLKSKILSLRAEGAVDFSSEYNVDWSVGFDKYGASIVDQEVFWGEKLATVAGRKLVGQRKLSSMDRVKIVGYPRLETYFNNVPKPVLPSRISDKISRYEKNRRILFISGFHLANYSKQDLFDAKDLNAENKLDELLEAVEITKKFRSDWTRKVITVADENPDSLIILKKHPIEKKEDYKTLENKHNLLFIYEDIQIDEIVPHVGIFFHYGSTALIDAYLSKVPAVYVYSNKNKHWYSDLGWPSNKRIEVEEINSAVKEYMDGKIYYESSPAIQKIMYDVFNLTEGITYEPSKEIAKLLLDPTPIQEISLFDKYFLSAAFFAVFNPVRWKFVGLYRRIVKMLKIIPNKFTKVTHQ